MSGLPAFKVQGCRSAPPRAANHRTYPNAPVPTPLPRFFLKRAPFTVPGGGELKLEHKQPAYQVRMPNAHAFGLRGDFPLH